MIAIQDFMAQCFLKARWPMYNIEVLEKKRLEKGLSYTEIADKLGIHKVTVSRTLKGITMKPRTVKLLADHLGVEMNRVVQ
jgi:transcriptional regulator with XRE-family HTH domain